MYKSAIRAITDSLCMAFFSKRILCVLNLVKDLVRILRLKLHL